VILTICIDMSLFFSTLVLLTGQWQKQAPGL